MGWLWRMRFHSCDDWWLWRMWMRLWKHLHHLHTATTCVHHMHTACSCVHHLCAASSCVHHLHAASSRVQHLYHTNLRRMWMWRMRMPLMEADLLSGYHIDPVIGDFWGFPFMKTK